MLIKKDSHGETQIEEVKGNEAPTLTIERVRQLVALNPGSSELSGLPTHEKLIWIKLKLDKEAPNITAGAN